MAPQVVEFRNEQAIITQGEAGRTFYVIESGKAVVSILVSPAVQAVSPLSLLRGPPLFLVKTTLARPLWLLVVSYSWRPILKQRTVAFSTAIR